VGTSDDARKLVAILVDGFVVWVGVALIVYSRLLALRYNAWTTRFRERHPNISKPPTAEMREFNTRVTTWLIRAVGAALVVEPIIEFISDRVWR
jgi:hypothetical protein